MMKFKRTYTRTFAIATATVANHTNERGVKHLNNYFFIFFCLIQKRKLDLIVTDLPNATHTIICIAEHNKIFCILFLLYFNAEITELSFIF